MTKGGLSVRAHLAPAQSSPRSETLADCTEPQENSSLRTDSIAQKEEGQKAMLWFRAGCYRGDKKQ